MVLKVNIPAETFSRMEKSIKSRGFYIEGLDSCDIYTLVNILEITPETGGQNVSVTLEVEEKFGNIVISRTLMNNLFNVIGIFPEPHAPGFMYVKN